MVNRAWGRRECVTNLISQLGWTTLERTRTEHQLCLLYRIVAGSTILNASDYVNPPSYIGRRDHSMKLRLFQCKRNYYADSFFPATVRKWNELPASTFLCDSADTFLRNLRLLRARLVCSHCG